MTRSFDRIAVINRGDAAVRLLHAVREQDAATGRETTVIAFYAAGEENARFVRESDERYCLGEPFVVGSDGERRLAYLDRDGLENALRATRPDAVWPGWGFVSEDPDFVELCDRLGIVFIGPQASTMRLLGDKIEAKKLAESVGVPVVDWSRGALNDVDEALAVAHELGYPLMLKAAGGGGGRGIRAVRSDAEMRAMFPAAVQEAAQAFGDRRVFLERSIEAARHIEIQVAGDEYGDLWVLGTRDCTLQRRHQKVVEEGGASVLPRAFQEKIQESAARLCKAAGYRNVGTVEFLVDADAERWYFMEVNPRLQVEHTVTEATTGVDLVRLQLDLAAGQHLDGAPPAPYGHAIQVRLNAENPHSLTPAPGRLEVFDIPDGPGIRVDSGFRVGDVIPPEYDSMIAKIIATGRTRSEAIARLRRALERFAIVIGGGASNRTFLTRLLTHPAVVANRYDTGWIDHTFLNEPDETDATVALLVAAVESYRQRAITQRTHFVSTARRGRPEISADDRPIEINYRGRAYAFDVRNLEPHRYQIGIGTDRVVLERTRTGPLQMRVRVADRDHDVTCFASDDRFYIEIGNDAFSISRGDLGLIAAASPGVVVGLMVKPGDRVAAGDLLAVVEAMKLETPVTAPADGSVAEVHVVVGGNVRAGDPMIRIDSRELSNDHAAPPGRSESFAQVVDTTPLVIDPLARMMGYDAPLEQETTAKYEPVATLELFRDLCALGRGRGGAGDEQDVARPGGERLLLAYLRSPDTVSDLLPVEYQDRITRLLDWYRQAGLAVDGASRDEALMRLFIAYRRLGETSTWIKAILRAEYDSIENNKWIRYEYIDEFIRLVEPRFPVIAEWARAVSEALQRFAHPGAVDHWRDWPIPDLGEPRWEDFELWRLADFDVAACPAPSGSLLVQLTGRENAADERLFAFVRARAIEPRLDQDGVMVFEPLTSQVADALAAMRHARLAGSAERRFTANRLVIVVEEDCAITDAELKDLAQRLAIIASGLELEKAVIRIPVVDPDAGVVTDTVVHMAVSHTVGFSVGRTAPSPRPLRNRTAAEQRLAGLRSRGLMTPSDIVNLMVAPLARDAHFPLGTFVEYDLRPEDGRLAPVARPIGRNDANIVVGIIANHTERYPEGFRRVILLSDPSRNMGALAEPECQRIIAALDLAQELDVPVEWFSVSSGARIAMDSGTENLDWTAAALRRIVEFTQAGNEINVVVSGINVGAQSYFDAEATMLMHSKGVLIMVGDTAMVLTGKNALDVSGSISAESDTGIGGYERVMAANGQAQYWTPDIPEACAVLFRYYESAYVAPGERRPRPRVSGVPVGEDVGAAAHPNDLVPAFDHVGAIFSDRCNPDRKLPFDIRSVMRAVVDDDIEPLERWRDWEGAESGVVWDTFIDGQSVTLLGVESHNAVRHGLLPADGPAHWTAGTLFPNSSKKFARALNSASGRRPVVVLANLSGFDGSPESMRMLQLEYGAELGRAVVNFDGSIVFCVLSRYHGGAFVVFSKRLNPGMTVVAVEGAKASVLGGAPAASVVFTREVRKQVAEDPRVLEMQHRLDAVEPRATSAPFQEFEALMAEVRGQVLNSVAETFDSIHTIERARQVGSVDAVVGFEELRPYVAAALSRAR